MKNFKSLVIVVGVVLAIVGLAGNSFAGSKNQEVVVEDQNSKALLCHNGKTISVSQNAVDAHLAHGDFVGSCEEENTCGEATLAFEDAKLAEADVDLSEGRVGGFYKTSSTHPNTPNTSGMHLNVFIDDGEFGDQLEYMADGQYHGRLEITGPDGNVIVVEVNFEAVKTAKKYYATYIKLVR